MLAVVRYNATPWRFLKYACPALGFARGVGLAEAELDKAALKDLLHRKI